MGWDVGATGLRIVLGAEVPDLVRAQRPRRRRRLPRRPRPDPRRHRLVGRATPAARRCSRPCRRRSSVDARGARRHLALARPHRQPLLGLGAARPRRHPRATSRPTPGSSGVLLAMGPGFCSELVLLRAPVRPPMTSSRCSPCWSRSSGVERLAELVVSKRHAAWAFSRGGVEYGRGALPVMVVLHTGLLVGALVEVWVGRPALRARARLVDAGARARGAGAALVVHRHARHGSGTPASSSSRACRWCSRGPYRLLRHPNYVAVVVEGVRPAAGARGLGDRAGLHGAQRGPAARADPRRERALAHRAARSRRSAVSDVCATWSSSGGGPVGLAAALYAVRAGLSRRRARAPGGPDRQGLRRGPDARRRAALAALGVSPPGHDLAGIRYVVGARTRPRRSSRHGPGRGVRRTGLHGALRAAVAAAGVDVLPLAAGEVTQLPTASVCRPASRAGAGPSFGPLPAGGGRAALPDAARLGLERAGAARAAAVRTARGTTAYGRGPASWRCTGVATARPT